MNGEILAVGDELLLGEAVGLDAAARRVDLSDGGPIEYDTLVVATGARHSYFGHDDWAAHAPGLKVICPAFPTDAKGLLKAAIRDDNPCVFLEHKWIFLTFKKEHSTLPPRVRLPFADAVQEKFGQRIHA